MAQRLESLPALTDAVERNQLSWCKLRALLRQATPENEKSWLSKALRHPMRVLERLLRQEAHGSRGQAAGSEAERVHLHLQLTVQEMALFQQSIRVLSETAGRPISAQEAFECLNAELLAGAAFPDEKSWKKLRDQVDKDLEARRQQGQWPAPPSEEDEEVEPEPEEVAEAPWEALAAVAIGCPGAPNLQLVQSARPHWENDRLSFNQSSRQITPAQRKEILRCDGYRCSVPGCPHMLWLQVHHIVYYCEGGVTLPDNLVAICSRRHRHIHQGLLQVEGETPQTLRWFDRQGREPGTAVEGLAEPITFEEDFLHWLVSVPLLE